MFLGFALSLVDVADFDIADFSQAFILDSYFAGLLDNDYLLG
jgi:hypothetical protein